MQRWKDIDRGECKWNRGWSCHNMRQSTMLKANNLVQSNLGPRVFSGNGRWRLKKTLVNFISSSPDFGEKIACAVRLKVCCWLKTMLALTISQRNYRLLVYDVRIRPIFKNYQLISWDTATYECSFLYSHLAIMIICYVKTYSLRQSSKMMQQCPAFNTASKAKCF